MRFQDCGALDNFSRNPGFPAGGGVGQLKPGSRDRTFKTKSGCCEHRTGCGHPGKKQMRKMALAVIGTDSTR